MIDYLISIGQLRASHRHGVKATLSADAGSVCYFHGSSVEYCPPAIASHWSGRWNSGSGPRLLQELADADSPRLSALRRSALFVPQETEKAAMVAELRNGLPDDGAEWVDACWDLRPDGSIEPIWSAGTGGNWGSQCLGTTAIRAALDVVSGRDGGDYSAKVYGDRQLTAIEFLMLIEGLIAIAPSATRRMSDDRTQPCRSLRCTSDFVANERTIGSYWLPLWDSPSTYPEIQQMLSNHPGWTTDVDAAIWASTKVHYEQRGISGYGRWAILQDGQTFRGLCP